MATDPEQLSFEPTPEDLVIDGVLTGDGIETDAWSDETPAIARGALVKADAIRRLRLDPGDAFLLGMGLRGKIERTQHEVDDLEEQFELDLFPELEAS